MHVTVSPTPQAQAIKLFEGLNLVIQVQKSNN